MKVQFNCQVPKAIAERIRADARRSGRTLDDVATAIFADFLKGWTVGERSKFYEQSGPKRAGRPIQKEAA